MKMLILGAGFSGRFIGARMIAGGASVTGTTRELENFDRLDAIGILPQQFDGRTFNDELLTVLKEATHLVVSIAPPREEDEISANTGVDPVLRAMADRDLRSLAPNLQWICYLSTVGVYGNHDGAWVDEDTPVAPASARSRQRVRAEGEWLARGEELEVPVAVFRLSGIYGPGRNAFVAIEAGRSRRLIKPGQVFNRIHVGDIAEAVFLGASQGASGIFNVTDMEPSPPQDVVTFAHHLMDTEPPAEIDFETANLTAMARSFYGENKRVSNARSRSVLGLDYAWPDYRTALTRMWNENTWRG